MATKCLFYWVRWLFLLAFMSTDPICQQANVPEKPKIKKFSFFPHTLASTLNQTMTHRNLTH